MVHATEVQLHMQAGCMAGALDMRAALGIRVAPGTDTLAEGALDTDIRAGPDTLAGPDTGIRAAEALDTGAAELARILAVQAGSCTPQRLLLRVQALLRVLLVFGQNRS